MTTTDRPWPKRWPEWLGSFPRLTGRQQPEYECWHPGDESEGDRTTKFGQRVGVHLLPWEWMAVRAIDSQQPANRWGIRLWTHRLAVIECTRQQGKTLILALIIIRRLFKHRRRIVYTAQQWATVEDVFDRVVAIIDRVPSLKRRLAAPPSKKDNRGVIRLKPIKGERHVVKADFGPRTQHFARGFTEIDDLILDEAYDLVPKHTANLTGAQAASENPQTIYASTPPVIAEHPNCHRFSALVRTVKSGGAPGMYGVLYRAPKRFKRDDPKAYPLAQPSYGVVGDDREMAAHLQGAKTAADRALFDADWLGWGDYPPPELEGDSEISADGWTAMGPQPNQPRSRLIGQIAVALERSPDGKTWTIEAAQRKADGRVHIEVGYHRAVSDAALVTAMTTLVSAWNPVVVVIRQGSSAAEVEDALRKAKIEPEMVNQTDVAQWCGSFLNAALDGRLSHSGQPELAEAVSHAQKHKLPRGGFIWELVDDASYAQLMGASLAYGALIKFADQAKKKPASPRGKTQGNAAAPRPKSSRRRGRDNVMEMAF